MTDPNFLDSETSSVKDRFVYLTEGFTESHTCGCIPGYTNGDGGGGNNGGDPSDDCCVFTGEPMKFENITFYQEFWDWQYEEGEEVWTKLTARNRIDITFQECGDTTHVLVEPRAYPEHTDWFGNQNFLTPKVYRKSYQDEDMNTHRITQIIGRHASGPEYDATVGDDFVVPEHLRPAFAGGVLIPLPQAVFFDVSCGTLYPSTGSVYVGIQQNGKVFLTLSTVVEPWYGATVDMAATFKEQCGVFAAYHVYKRNGA